MTTDEPRKWHPMLTCGAVGGVLVLSGVSLLAVANQLEKLASVVPGWCYWLYWPTLATVMACVGGLPAIVGVIWLQFETAFSRATRLGVAAAAILLAGLLFRPAVNRLLFYGASVPSEGVVRLAIGLGADPNCQDSEGGTPLCGAAARAPLSTCKVLIDHGADVNRGNPLAYAATWGDAATIKLLIQSGADVNASGGEALVNAVIRGYPELVRLMLDAGANLGARDARGYSALFWAVDRDAVDHHDPRADHYRVAVDLITRGADAKALGPSGETLLMAGARGDKVSADLMRLLITKGVDPNAKSPTGETALMEVVCYSWRTDVAKILIDAGADPNMPGRAPEGLVTPLRKASTRSDKEMVSLLKSCGARE